MNDRPTRAAGMVAAKQSRRRLLIPIDATERSRWALSYACSLYRAGEEVDTVLLFVAEPITSWQVLRFRTHEEIARFQSQRAQFLLEDAAEALRAVGVPYHTVFRVGEIVFQILDAAEQLDCNEIVLPEPPPLLLALLSQDTARQVLRHQREIPVVTVDEHGVPNGARVEH